MDDCLMCTDDGYKINREGYTLCKQHYQEVEQVFKQKENKMSRHFTNLLLENLEEGLYDKDFIILCCVKYMSEDDVQNMMEINDLI